MKLIIVKNNTMENKTGEGQELFERSPYRNTKKSKSKYMFLCALVKSLMIDGEGLGQRKDTDNLTV